MKVSQAEEVTLIPREVLFGNPEKAAPRISPDGERIAYLAPVDGVLNVWLKSVGKSDDHPITRDADRGIRAHFWAPNNREVLYVQDQAGNENWRLYGVDPATGKVREFTPFENTQVGGIFMDKHFPGEILIGLNKDNPALHDVYRLDLKTGKLALEVKNPGNVSDWMTNAELKVRGALAASPKGGFDLLIRESDDAPWREFLHWGSRESFTTMPVGFSKDGSAIFLKDARESDTNRLVRIDIRTKEAEVLAHDPEYDVSEVVMDPDTREVQLVGFERDRSDYLVLDPSLKDDLEKLKKLHKGDLVLVNRDYSGNVWVAAFVADDGPMPYYVYDRRSGEAIFLFENMPALKKYTLAPMEPVRITSRDGLTLHAYVTFPPGRARVKLPMVLRVHGGPWARDSWGYSAEAQWLANRGYICLQVNYRGSTGYGKDFVRRAAREWGGKMHDDLVDAVKWAVDKGYADPDRVAIYGGSYGGYAALVGAAFTPDLFKCAVDLVGPSNLLTFIRSVPPYWSVYLNELYENIGHPEKDAEFLKSRSPLFKVDQIRIPLLIAQGANDPRVKQAESEQIVAALKEKGIDHEYLLFEDEGHGFAKPQNRLKFYRACERFLSRHLGGRFQD